MAMMNLTCEGPRNNPSQFSMSQPSHTANPVYKYVSKGGISFVIVTIESCQEQVYGALDEIW